MRSLGITTKKFLHLRRNISLISRNQWWPCHRYLCDDNSQANKHIIQADFTCTVCNHRNSIKFTKHSYTKGVVLARCEGCEKFHLIADNKGWFSDSKINIEDILKAKGEKVKVFGATIEYNDEQQKQQ